ncbi:MarR family winged helix-turn-helix transcriptional regulator [Paenibacillus albidus]|uniref:MarR family winged helix-turn-helix transcriptional regulator n=1 Tax=Paenibacillus albidus TaxID=2041023 RepID=UPI0035713684
MLGSAHRRISTLFARALKPYDITPEQWSVLLMIAGREGINQKEVALGVSKDQPTTARIVELLQKKGFVTKMMSPSDRRAFLLYATDQGKHLIDTTLLLEQQVTSTAFAGLKPQQLEDLRMMLELIHHNTANSHQE